MTKLAYPLDALTDDQRASLKPYQAGLDEDGQPVSKYKYRPGSVRQYRFDGKAGTFNINGDQVGDFSETDHLISEMAEH